MMPVGGNSESARLLLLPASLRPEQVFPTDWTGVGVHGTVLTLDGPTDAHWSRHFPTWEVLRHASLRVPQHEAAGPDHDLFRRALDRLLADPRTTHIMMREWAPGVVDQSPFNFLPRLGDVCWNSMRLLNRTRPQAVVMRSTPHLVEPWVIGQLAEQFDIPVLITADAILPGRAWMVRGIDRQQPVALAETDAEQDGRLVQAVRDYTENLAADYERGAPPLHRRSLRRSRQAGWSPRVEWRDFALHQRNGGGLRHRIARFGYSLRRSAQRHALWNSYRGLVSDTPAGLHTATMFLHYQPERTTLPEAGRYGNQFELARLLALSLPRGWHLQVREHPATFVGPGPFHAAFRSPELYERLAELPRTSLIELDTDPFAVIDESSLVATCTGTVGLESLFRGSPVVVAGLAQYRSTPGVLDLTEGHASVAEAVHGFAVQVENGQTPVPSLEELRRHVASRLAYSFGPAPGGWSYNGQFRDAAHGLAIRAAVEAAIDGTLWSRIG